MVGDIHGPDRRLYDTHIRWSIACATAAPVPVPVVGGGSPVKRVTAPSRPFAGELLCAPAPHFAPRPLLLYATPCALTHACPARARCFREGGRATAHHKTNKH